MLFASSLLGLHAQDTKAPEFKATLGRSVVTVTGNWSFHVGDNLAWAQPALDDRTWETISADQPWGMQGHPGYTGFAWYRKVLAIDGAAGPVAINLPPIDGCYELYWNGQRIGGLGTLPPHPVWYQSPLGNAFTLSGGPPNSPGTARGVLAIRVWTAMLSSIDTIAEGGLTAQPRIGDRQLIANELDLRDATRMRVQLIRTVLQSTLLLVGCTALLMWAFDRSRRLHLWLGVFLLGLGAPIVGAFPFWFRHVPFTWVQTFYPSQLVFKTLGIWMLVSVLFELDREKTWRTLTAVFTVIYLCGALGNIAECWLWSFGWPALRSVDGPVTSILYGLPVYLFVLLAAGLRRRRDLALLPAVLACAALGSYRLIVDALGEFPQLTGFSYGAIVAWGRIQLGLYRFDFEDQLTAITLVVLVGTVYREQMRERRRQLFVESELESAQEVQSILVPEETPTVPGFAISSLYWPAGEVGGDMFQVLPGNQGDVLIVLADVSGKGLKAAMTVSLLVGTVRTLSEYTWKPLEIMQGMNRRLVGRTTGGFATCLLLHISASGEVTMTNAGHLPPFLNGQVMALEGSLPLGLCADAEFPESRFTLHEGDEVTLYTDGVLEAQNEKGDLFGFDRSAALMRSRPSVLQVAEAAKTFGQQDDIAVLKILRVAAHSARELMSVDLGTVAV